MQGSEQLGTGYSEMGGNRIAEGIWARAALLRRAGQTIAFAMSRPAHCALI